MRSLAATADTIRVDAGDLPIWPEGQAVKGRGDQVIAMATFEDAPRYHPALIDKVLRLYDDPSVKRVCSVSSAGTKIHGIGDWGFPEADLVNARAIELFKRVYGKKQGLVHVSWANISRQGEYSMPHAHPDCEAVAVYCLDPGEPNPIDPLDGILAFVDPRYKACCRAIDGYMTTPVMPNMKAGSLIIFPSTLVHCVSPYQGTRPRITFSWDLTDRLRGRPRVMDEIDREYGAGG